MYEKKAMGYSKFVTNCVPLKGEKYSRTKEERVMKAIRTLRVRENFAEGWRKGKRARLHAGALRGIYRDRISDWISDLNISPGSPCVQVRTLTLSPTVSTIIYIYIVS